jgi:3-(3-hydroxy-phenyl)propionate hydroxylase
MHDPHTRTDSLYFEYPIFPFVKPPEMAGQTVTHQVVVAGGGPSGLILALELARFGIKSVVIEADETVSEGSRAACVSRRSMEILQANGVEKPFLDQALEWIHGTSYYREHEVFRLTMPHSEDERFYPMANLQQNIFEELLVRRAEALGIEIRWRSKVVGVRQSGGQVELDIDTPEDVYTLRARYVVAADGARSELRRLMGLKLNGESHEGRYLIADIRMASSYPTERRAWFDPASHPGKSVLVHKMARDIWRVDYALDPDDDEETEMQEDRVKAQIQRHLDYIGEKTPWTLDWVRLYKAHCLCLDDYRQGNVFFIGDAAHLVPIFGVRGMNSSMADANNLGWKLAAVINGTAPDALLDSYSPERRAATFDVFANAAKSTRFMTPPTRGYTLLRDAALQLAVHHDFARQWVNPRQSAPYDYVASSLTTPDSDPFFAGPRPGAPLASVKLADGSYLTDVVSARFVLLVFGKASIDASALAALQPPVALQPVTDAHAIEAYGAIDGTGYLVRPDGHVCARWKTTSVDQVRAALQRVTARSGT